MIGILWSLAAALYVLAGLLLTVFVGSFAILLGIYLWTRHSQPELPSVGDGDLPSVTVQLPVYNEAHVIGRLIDACAQFDYPRGRFCVQVLDDSTDETTLAIRHKIAEWRARGVDNIVLVRRPQRTGYKAGALAYGLERVDTDCIAVFDADFVPPADFLRRTMPYFNCSEGLALVQTRWDHLNADTNWLTRAQALTMDQHFAIEQVARSRGHLPMSMNGSGAVWRTAALRDAGGWSPATVTEDLDLSYRALMRGWEFIYLVGVPVPGELPPQVQAYKVQQNRWATGMTECLIRHALPLLRSRRYGWGKKFMGIMHLSQYAVQPLILLMFLLTPALLWGDMFRRLPNLGFLGAVSVIPLLLVAVAQAELRRDWYRRLLYLPVQLLVGAALVLNNTAGVLAALHPPGIQREFRRTPKFNVTRQGQNWFGSRYTLAVDAITLGEIALGAYAVGGTFLALERLPALALYMASYALSFFGFAFSNIYQTRQCSEGRRRVEIACQDAK
jgi:cellulose synthase/poly-beta-1,6-N-acetylglucosamine synthase-like glycosyltransferase